VGIFPKGEGDLFAVMLPCPFHKLTHIGKFSFLMEHMIIFHHARLSFLPTKSAASLINRILRKNLPFHNTAGANRDFGYKNHISTLCAIVRDYYTTKMLTCQHFRRNINISFIFTQKSPCKTPTGCLTGEVITGFSKTR
jgi:hypothetical protein